MGHGYKNNFLFCLFLFSFPLFPPFSSRLLVACMVAGHNTHIAHGYLTSIEFDIVRYYLCTIEQNIVRCIVRIHRANISHDASHAQRESATGHFENYLLFVAFCFFVECIQLRPYARHAILWRNLAGTQILREIMQPPWGVGSKETGGRWPSQWPPREQGWTDQKEQRAERRT